MTAVSDDWIGRYRLSDVLLYPMLARPARTCAGWQRQSQGQSMERPAGGLASDCAGRVDRTKKGLDSFLFGVAYAFLINLPVAYLALLDWHLGHYAFINAAAVVSIPSLLMFIKGARWLGGRWWLVAIFLSTFPILVIQSSVAMIAAPAIFGWEDRFAVVGWLDAIFFLLAGVAVLSLIGAAFYGPLSRWVEHRRASRQPPIHDGTQR